MKRELTCIGCPMGCLVEVELLDGHVINVAGNTCKRGEDYARKEVTNPTRIVTSTVRVKNGSLPVVSVKTKEDVPKEKIFQVMEELKNVEIEAPVHIGQTVAHGIAGTETDVITTKEISKIS